MMGMVKNSVIRVVWMMIVVCGGGKIGKFQTAVKPTPDLLCV